MEKINSCVVYMQDSELLANMSRYTQTSVKVTNASFTVLMLRVRAKWVNYYY